MTEKKDKKIDKKASKKEVKEVKKVSKKEVKEVKKVSKKEVKEEEKKPENLHILSHKYNPKFEVISQEEVEKLLDDFGMNLLQLPKINKNDPICKLLKVDINDVVKIIRQSYTSGESIFYRVVTNE